MKTIDYLTKELVSAESYNNFAKIFKILPNPDKVLKRTAKTMEAYRDLLYDPHLWSCIQSRKSGVLSLDYTIVSNGINSSIIKDIEKIFYDLDIQQIERDMLEAPLFGFQPLEIMWSIVGKNRRFIVPEKIIAKPQEWFIYDNLGLLRFKKSGYSEGIIAPKMKILNVQYEPTYLNPYGQSLLAKCYWHITFKNGGLRFWVNFTEKYGMPILMGQYQRGATNEESQRLADELAKMTEDSVIVAPSDIKIELKEAVKSSSMELYKELINYCNNEISKAILSQTLTTELNNGSLAAAQIHYQVRREVILSDIRLVEAAMNLLIKYIIDLNYSINKYPHFKIMLNDSDNVQKIDRDVNIAKLNNIKYTKKYLIDTYGFQSDDLIVM